MVENKHQYSTYTLIILLLVVCSTVAIALTSGDVDTLCNETSSILYRNGTEWGCSTIQSQITNETLQTVTDRGASTTNEIQTPGIILEENVSRIVFDYVDKPDISSSTLSTSTTGGTIPANNYKLAVTFLDDEGHETDPTGNIDTSITTTGSTSTITINNLPVSPNPKVTKRNIYMGTSTVFLSYQKTINDNTATSATVTFYETTTGNDILRNKGSSSGTDSFGNTLGGIFQNEKGEELFSVGQEGQFYMTGDRAQLLFPQKNINQFDPLPIMFFSNTDIPLKKDDYSYASMYFDVNDNDIFKIGTFGRGSYSAKPVEIHSDQPGVEFSLGITRGDPIGWINMIDGGTSSPNVDFYRISNNVWSSSYSVNTLIRMDGATTQSGSAGYTLIDVDFDNSGFSGSGVEEFMNLKTDGTSQFSISATGETKAQSFIAEEHTTFTSDGANGIINTTDGTLHIYNETGYGIVEAHDFITHSFQEDSTNPLSLFVGKNSSQTKCKTLSTVKDYTRPVYINETINYLSVTSDTEGVENLLFTYNTTEERSKIINDLTTGVSRYYYDYSETKTITTHPYTKEIVGTSEGCMNELQFATLKQINEAVNIIETNEGILLDADIISAEAIYTESKVPQPDVNYCLMIMESDIYQKETHYAYKELFEGKFVLDSEQRDVVTEGCEKQKLIEMCAESNNKYSWCQ